jgi:hypothetical protein
MGYRIRVCGLHERYAYEVWGSDTGEALAHRNTRRAAEDYIASQRGEDRANERADELGPSLAMRLSAEMHRRAARDDG